MVIMDMENGDQVSKQGCLCHQDSRGEVTPITPLIYATLLGDKLNDIKNIARFRRSCLFQGSFFNPNLVLVSCLSFIENYIFFFPCLKNIQFTE